MYAEDTDTSFGLLKKESATPHISTIYKWVTLNRYIPYPTALPYAEALNAAEWCTCLHNGAARVLSRQKEYAERIARM